MTGLRISFLKPQSFSTAIALHTSKRTRQQSPSTPAYVSPSVSDYASFSSVFEKRSHPTILYEAPSHTGYMLSSYCGATFCLLWAATNLSSNFFFAPADIAFWVPYTFALISIMMAGLGTFLLLAPARIIKSITAIPSKLRRVPGLVGNATKAGNAAGRSLVLAKPGHQELTLEIELRKMFPMPFFPPRKLVASPKEVEFTRRLFVAEKKLSPAMEIIKRREEEAAHQKWLEYEKAHLLTAPFRDFKKAMKGGFVTIRRTWTSEGFMKVFVHGQGYKLDTSSGWVLDEGKPLDRLVKINNSN